MHFPLLLSWEQNKAAWEASSQAVVVVEKGESRTSPGGFWGLLAHVMRNEMVASKQKSEACSFDLTSVRREEREKKKHITSRVGQKA